MNIFELILSEPLSYQQSDFAGQQGTWALFKQNIAALFGQMRPADVETFMGRSRELWAATKRSAPELLPVMVEYYMSTCNMMQMSWKESCTATSAIRLKS